MLPKVLYTYGDRAGMHEGKVNVPRKPRIDIEQSGPLDGEATGMNFANLDGDHVLVGFIEDDTKQPYIDKFLPHPRADRGGDLAVADPPGRRLRPVEADGEVDLRKHRGSFWGIDDKGALVIDLTRAHAGEYDADGSEPAPAVVAPSPADPPFANVHGNIKADLPNQAVVRIRINTTTEVVLTQDKFNLRIDGGENLTLDLKDANAQLKLGNGEKHAAIVETLEALWGAAKSIFDAHIHPTGVGPSSTTPTPLPGWDAGINSTKVSFPDG